MAENIGPCQEAWLRHYAAFEQRGLRQARVGTAEGELPYLAYPPGLSDYEREREFGYAMPALFAAVYGWDVLLAALADYPAIAAAVAPYTRTDSAAD